MKGAALIVGWVVDEIVGDPARFHPVAGFGRVAAAVEVRTYADSRRAGILHTVGLVVASALAGSALDRLARPIPFGRFVIGATATWAVLGGRSLRDESAAVAARLEEQDLPGARRQVARIVGRQTEALDETGVARAVVETVAENTVDAAIAPLFWGAVAGIPGLTAYRAINTLDAMIGHHTTRYERFGWAAAKLDDIANYLPARLSAALALASAPTVGGDALSGWRAVRRDARRHPSPNGGVVEAAFAGVLGVRLGGTNMYADRVEDRGTLGDGRPPGAGDIPRANRLSRNVVRLLIGALAGVEMIRITRSAASSSRG